jgi:MarR family transcriptional regulator, organic hydroperoxide resistance regulator
MAQLPDRESARIVFNVAHRLMHAVGAEARSHVSEMEITPHQGFALRLLSMRQRSMAELAQCMRVTPATATGVIDRLVQKGIVRRIEDTTDRRVVRLEVTDEGWQILNSFQRRIDDLLAEFLRRIAPEDVAALVRGMKALERTLGPETLEECFPPKPAVWSGTAEDNQAISDEVREEL